MIINWIKKNFLDYPKFYQNYLETFKTNNIFNQFIVFDLDIHNSNEDSKKIMRIFAFKVINQEFFLKDSIDLIIENEFNEEETNKIIEAEAIIQFINFIKNSPLISYQVNDKVILMNQILKKIEAGKVENEIFDLEILFKTHQKLDSNQNIFSLQKISEVLKLKEFREDNLIEKVYFQALTFLKLNKKLKIEETIKNILPI